MSTRTRYYDDTITCLIEMGEKIIWMEAKRNKGTSNILMTIWIDIKQPKLKFKYSYVGGTNNYIFQVSDAFIDEFTSLKEKETNYSF